MLFVCTLQHTTVKGREEGKEFLKAWPSSLAQPNTFGRTKLKCLCRGIVKIHNNLLYSDFTDGCCIAQNCIIQSDWIQSVANKKSSINFPQEWGSVLSCTSYIEHFAPRSISELLYYKNISKSWRNLWRALDTVVCCHFLLMLSFPSSSLTLTCFKKGTKRCYQRTRSAACSSWYLAWYLAWLHYRWKLCFPHK